MAKTSQQAKKESEGIFLSSLLYGFIQTLEVYSEAPERLSLQTQEAAKSMKKFNLIGKITEFDLETWWDRHWLAMCLLLPSIGIAFLLFVTYGDNWRFPTTEERCTFQNGTYVKMIDIEKPCDKVVDRWISQGYYVQRYGIRGNDFIVLEKKQ